MVPPGIAIALTCSLNHRKLLQSWCADINSRRLALEVA